VEPEVVCDPWPVKPDVGVVARERVQLGSRLPRIDEEVFEAAHSECELRCHVKPRLGAEIGVPSQKKGVVDVERHAPSAEREQRRGREARKDEARFWVKERE